MQVFGWIVGVLFLFLAGFIGIPPFLFADDLNFRLTQTVSVADLIAYAKLKNPSIREVREEWRGVIEEYRLMTGYPDPELSVTYYPSPLETRLGPQDWTASFSQRIPFPGKLSKAGEVVKANAQIAQIKLDKTVREVIAGVRESYHELLYIRKAGEVAAQNLKLLKHLRKVSETAYARDRAVLMDMVKAQAQLGQLRYDALLLEELEMTEKTTLNGLLNRPPDAKIGRLLDKPYRPIAFKLKKLYQLAEANREEVRIAQMRVKKAEAEVELAEYENLPDFKVGVFYSSIGDPDVPQRPSGSGRDALGVQVGLSIPLWFEKNRGRKGRALAGIEKAKSAKTAFVNDTRTRVHYLFFRLENSRRLVFNERIF